MLFSVHWVHVNCPLCPLLLPPIERVLPWSLVVIASAYHLCSVHVLCVCVLFVITCCVYPTCLCGRVCCVTRSTLSTLEVDMALLPVSRLTCGSWSLEWNIVLTLSLLTQHILYQLCQWVVQVSDQSCFFLSSFLHVG